MSFLSIFDLFSKFHFPACSTLFIFHLILDAMDNFFVINLVTKPFALGVCRWRYIRSFPRSKRGRNQGRSGGEAKAPNERARCAQPPRASRRRNGRRLTTPPNSKSIEKDLTTISSRCVSLDARKVILERKLHSSRYHGHGLGQKRLCIALYQPTLPSVFTDCFRVLDTIDCLHVPGTETYCTKILYSSDIISRQILFRLHVIKFGFIVKHCFLYNVISFPQKRFAHRLGPRLTEHIRTRVPLFFSRSASYIFILRSYSKVPETKLVLVCYK